jgi:hypothetical protein
VFPDQSDKIAKEALQAEAFLAMRQAFSDPPSVYTTSVFNKHSLKLVAFGALKAWEPTEANAPLEKSNCIKKKDQYFKLEADKFTTSPFSWVKASHDDDYNTELKTTVQNGWVIPYYTNIKQVKRNEFLYLKPDDPRRW